MTFPVVEYAFNTVCRDRLMMLMRKRLNLSEETLEWFDSYLNGRMVSVRGQGCKTGFAEQKCGVSQGSALQCIGSAPRREGE